MRHDNLGTDIEIDFLDAVQAFIDRVVRPVEVRYAGELAETGTIDPARQLDERRQLRRRSAAAGLYGAAMPEEVGGEGLNVGTIAHSYRLIGASGLLLADRGGVLPNVEGPQAPMIAMSPEQRDRYLAPLIRAEIEGCFAITEPGAGSDAANVQTTAKMDGDYWVINGTKQFITHAAYADFVQVVAVTDPDASAARRLTAFLVDMDSPGVSVGATHCTLGEDRPVDLYFDGVRVPDSAIVGGRGRALHYALAGIGRARINIGALAIGKCEYLLQRMTEYASQRTAFGRTIGGHQFVQGHIVDSGIEIEAARGLLRSACEVADQDDERARRLSATTKVYATEALSRVADRAIQVFGGSGVTHSTGIERFYRDARAMRIYEGTSEVLRWNIARWMGLPSS
ncbi:acyl-CoA dehydrogenase [Rhodococcus sp. T2V]|uniref:acyl-CoA dehydrogenase family protein n=1 Tax=Rhodococcus sp. T2V TaxID=3034164 RepID=UPI0023E2D536|nr:acyl-CoA dehydrogenase [Rhodococcus sp. T2V]MDF3312050.1 acyl-CoA dehydrogenase [Rhodococcus sp. T2V]